MPYFWQLTINPKLKTQNSIISFGKLIHIQKSFLFCTPRLETQQPVLPYSLGCIILNQTRCVQFFLNLPGWLGNTMGIIRVTEAPEGKPCCWWVASWYMLCVVWSPCSSAKCWERSATCCLHTGHRVLVGDWGGTTRISCTWSKCSSNLDSLSLPIPHCGQLQGSVELSGLDLAETEIFSSWNNNVV